MEKYIIKLNEIKSLLKLPDGTYRDYDKELYHSLISRINSIVQLRYGVDNIYNKRLDSFKKSEWYNVRSSDLDNLKVLIDIIIDDIELTEKKEENIIAPLLKEQKNLEIAEEMKALNNNIFIVHGHNEAMKQTVARTIEKLNLTPIILHEKTNQGQTLIEKFLTNSNVGFTIVLLSADDVGYSIKEGETKAKNRARQNVIFELGFFTAKLGRKRVIALVDGKSDFELPSDFHGVIYIPYDGDTGKWKFDVAKELMESGYSINVNNII